MIVKLKQNKGYNRQTMTGQVNSNNFYLGGWVSVIFNQPISATDTCCTDFRTD